VIAKLIGHVKDTENLSVVESSQIDIVVIAKLIGHVKDTEKLSVGSAT